MSLTDDPRILRDPEPRFIIVSYDDSAITIRLRVHSAYADFFDLGHDLRRQLKTALDSHGIGIPFPTRPYAGHRQYKKYICGQMSVEPIIKDYA